MRFLITLVCFVSFILSLTGCGIVKRATRIIPARSILLGYSPEAKEIEISLENLEIACEDVSE